MTDSANNTTADARQAVIYYDRSCPVCRAEVEALELHKSGCELRDCSAAGFLDADASAAGIRTRDMMAAMHVRDADGRWTTGIDAIASMYQHAGRARSARILRVRALRPLFDLAYRVVARNRTFISRLGLHKLLGFLLRTSAPSGHSKSQRIPERKAAGAAEK